jgi:hypothetical protein
MQLVIGRISYKKQSVGILIPRASAASRIVAPSGTWMGFPSMVKSGIRNFPNPALAMVYGLLFKGPNQVFRLKTKG